MNIEGYGVLGWLFVTMVVGWLISRYGKEGFVQLGEEHEEAMANGPVEGTE